VRLPSYRRTVKQRLRLVGEICPNCGAKLFPPRDVCPECSGPANEPYEFSGQGTVYSYATTTSAPERFKEYTPYSVALVRLKEGPLVTAQLTDVKAEEVYIGMPVEMVTRRMYQEGEDGIIVYNYKFRPQLQKVSDVA